MSLRTARRSNTPCSAAVAEKMATKKSAYLICGMKLGKGRWFVTATPETDEWALSGDERSEIWITFKR